MSFSFTRADIDRAILAAIPTLDSSALARATGAAARAMVGATDTGQWHGPVEGFVSENGYALTTTPNGIHSFAAWRLRQRAADLRDVGTLRAFAREEDRAGTTTAAAQTRELADVFAFHATVDAYSALDESSRTSDADAVGFVGPAIGEAYHRPSDMFVDVVGRDGHAVVFRSPMGFTDRCAPAFLRNILTGGNPLLANYVYGL